MSSSRSIAAARNRRAGEQQPVQTRSGPGTSIASQAAFVQQMSQDQRAMGGKNQMSQGRQMNQQQPQVTSLANGIPAGAKLSISDAIGLITLRLGKVEQFIIQLENEILPSLRGQSNISDNSQQIDRSVINSVVNRLDALEKTQKEILSGNINLNKDSSNDNTAKLEKELREIKESLMTQIIKNDQFSYNTENKIKEIHQRLSDIDGAFVELENQINIQVINDETQVSHINEEDSNINNSLSNEQTQIDEKSSS
jgi:hypothetical protein